MFAVFLAQEYFIPTVAIADILSPQKCLWSLAVCEYVVDCIHALFEVWNGHACVYVRMHVCANPSGSTLVSYEKGLLCYPQLCFNMCIYLFLTIQWLCTLSTVMQFDIKVV